MRCTTCWCPGVLRRSEGEGEGGLAWVVVVVCVIKTDLKRALTE